MIAAIYCRKSTEQSGVSDDQKSVARQSDHARQYAERKGWTIEDRFVFVDDGISGAEFSNRPGFVRLMNTLKPLAPFEILIMSEISRLGREQIETAYALKQLSVAGARCFSDLEDRELLIESATDKLSRQERSAAVLRLFVLPRPRPHGVRERPNRVDDGGQRDRHRGVTR